MSILSKILNRKVSVEDREETQERDSTDDAVQLDVTETPTENGETAYDDYRPRDDRREETTEEEDTEKTSEDNDTPSDEEEGEEAEDVEAAADDIDVDVKEDGEGETKEGSDGEDSETSKGEVKEAVESLEALHEGLTGMIHRGDTSDTTISLVQSITSLVAGKVIPNQVQVTPSVEGLNHTATGRRLTLNVVVEKLGGLIYTLKTR